jgi:hypothetical protein
MQSTAALLGRQLREEAGLDTALTLIETHAANLPDKKTVEQP